jgi:hypothetical protein
MKARQIAPGFRSVYAIGPLGEVQVIERGADGLWGRWQVTPLRAKGVVNGGGLVATVGLDDAVSTFERGIWQPGHTLDREARELVSTHVPGLGPVLLVVDQEGVSATWKESPAASWHAWTTLEGPVRGLDAALLAERGIAVFGIRDGAVQHGWQVDARARWEGWSSLGAPSGATTMVRAQTISGGGLAIFAVGADGIVYHRWQDTPQGRWRAWQSLGGEVRNVAVTKSSSGGLALFAVGADDTVRYRYQSRPFGPWSDWTPLYGRVREIAAQPSYTDGLEVFAIGLDQDVHHAWSERIDAPWTAWTALDYELSPFHSPVARAML